MALMPSMIQFPSLKERKECFLKEPVFSGDADIENSLMDTVGKERVRRMKKAA